MLSANSGPRLVWFEFPTPGEPEVVVYDTSAGREVARDTVRLGPGHTAVPGELTDRFVYWFKDPDPGELPEDQTQVRYDPATGEQSRITEADAARGPGQRGGGALGPPEGGREADSSGTFHYSDGMGQQMDVGLQKGVAGVNGVAPVGGGDMVAMDVQWADLRFRAAPGLHRARPVSPGSSSGSTTRRSWCSARCGRALT